jgi:hypothetical protein
MADDLKIKQVRNIEIAVMVFLGLVCLAVLVCGFAVMGGKQGATFFDKFEVIIVWIEGIGTIGILTILYRENPISRFFEHLLIGVSMGYALAVTWTNIIWPNMVQPCFGLDSKPVNLLWLATLPFGALFYFQLSKKYNWVSKFIICFSMGWGSGAAFDGTFNTLLGPDGQLTRTIIPLFRPIEPGWTLWNFFLKDLIIVFVCLAVLSYFFFSFRHEKNLPLRASSKMGRYFLMIMFGAVFGNTVMGRMSLLINRLTFLFTQWFDYIIQVFKTST